MISAGQFFFILVGLLMIKSCLSTSVGILLITASFEKDLPIFIFIEHEETV
jgi:branched-subunit amino acid permease